MTRINLVHPSTLHTKHLIAEYRELPRVFALAEAAHLRGAKLNMPTEYVLGTGHVTFFYNKLGFLMERFDLILAECDKRGFSVKHRITPVANVPWNWYNSYVPTEKAIALNMARIAERMPRQSRSASKDQDSKDQIDQN